MQKAVIDLIASRMVEGQNIPILFVQIKGFLWTDSNKIIIDIKE